MMVKRIYIAVHETDGKEPYRIHSGTFEGALKFAMHWMRDFVDGRATDRMARLETYRNTLNHFENGKNRTATVEEGKHRVHIEHAPCYDI